MAIVTRNFKFAIQFVVEINFIETSFDSNHQGCIIIVHFLFNCLKVGLSYSISITVLLLISHFIFCCLFTYFWPHLAIIRS